ncbi:MAG: hypothetical protein ACOYWZ_13045 [Bacillota bacterium]
MVKQMVCSNCGAIVDGETDVVVGAMEATVDSCIFAGFVCMDCAVKIKSLEVEVSCDDHLMKGLAVLHTLVYGSADGEVFNSLVINFLPKGRNALEELKEMVNAGRQEE